MYSSIPAPIQPWQSTSSSRTTQSLQHRPRLATDAAPTQRIARARVLIDCTTKSQPDPTRRIAGRRSSAQPAHEAVRTAPASPPILEQPKSVMTRCPCRGQGVLPYKWSSRSPAKASSLIVDWACSARAPLPHPLQGA